MFWKIYLFGVLPLQLLRIAFNVWHHYRDRDTDLKPGEEHFTGQVIGWRRFFVQDDNGRWALYPIFMSHGGPFVNGAPAECALHASRYRGLRESDEPIAPVPSIECDCGYYSFNTVLQCVRFNLHEDVRLVARVALSGRIIDCTMGYRSEHMNVLDVWFKGPVDPATVADLERTYGCAVHQNAKNRQIYWAAWRGQRTKLTKKEQTWVESEPQSE